MVWYVQPDQLGVRCRPAQRINVCISCCWRLQLTWHVAVPAGEDQYGVLAQYYSIPWLSYRDAVWHDYMANTPGFKRYEIFPREEERHPTPLGHRWVEEAAPAHDNLGTPGASRWAVIGACAQCLCSGKPHRSKMVVPDTRMGVCMPWHPKVVAVCHGVWCSAGYKL